MSDRLSDVVARLGLTTRGTRFGPCPACQSARAGRKDSRPPIGVSLGRHTGEPRWHCSACDQGGDAARLVMAAHGVTYREACRWIEDPHGITEHRPRAPEPPKPEEPERPPRAEVLRLAHACTPLDPHAAGYLRSRNIDPTQAPVRQLPAPDHPVWPTITWRRPNNPDARPWLSPYHARRYPLVIFATDHHGHPQLPHVRAADDTTRPKSRWCGADVRGLLFMSAAARRWLRPENTGRPPEVLYVAEGMTDFLRVCSLRPRAAVLGLESGSHHALFNLPWSPQTTVYDLTDDDAAGYRYSLDLARALAPRIPIRPRWSRYAHDRP